MFQNTFIQKRAIIVHNWSGSPKSNWYPWLKVALEKKGFEVQVPAMSERDDPVIADWVGTLERIVGDSDEHTYFVAHSIGCQAVMRYLAAGSKKAGGCVFVAGWFKMENLEDEETEEIAKPWIETPIDFTGVLAATSNVTVFLSDNDPYGQVSENKRMFQENLNAAVVVLHNKGHFTADSGAVELPEALKAVLTQTSGA